MSMGSFQDGFEEKIKEFIPGQSIDCIIFGYQDFELKVLLLKWKDLDLWSLPGGFIYQTEDMNLAANRILKERTGLVSAFLNQFYTFGDVNRRGVVHQDIRMDIFEFSDKIKEWFSKRFITTGYISLVKIAETNPVPDEMSDRCEWVSINSLPKLSYDHADIIRKAKRHLSTQLNYLPLGKSVLNNKFTMPDLHKLYEAILDRPLDRANFQKKMLKLGIFIRHEKHLTGAANKAPYLYSFEENKYAELIAQGIGYV